MVAGSVSFTPVAKSIWWKALVISLVAALPPWLVSAVVLGVLFSFGSTGPQGSLHQSLSVPFVLIPIIAAALGVATVVVLSARGRFRSDLWWLAGGLLVIDALVAMLIVGVPLFGEGVFAYITLSSFTGYWILVFVAGALTWRRLTLAFIPTDWLKPKDPEDE